jgi:CheY-like chemotaxis protein
MNRESGSPGAILIVDDDQDFLLQQQLVLESAGYRVRMAGGRAEAEAALTEERPDALVVDLMMEENDDGFVLCFAAKKLYPDLPVIMVTGVASETGIEFDTVTSEERSWIKADAFLAKPIRPEQILQELERLLGQVVNDAGEK